MGIPSGLLPAAGAHAQQYLTLPESSRRPNHLKVRDIILPVNRGSA